MQKMKSIFKSFLSIADMRFLLILFFLVAPFLHAEDNALLALGIHEGLLERLEKLEASIKKMQESISEKQQKKAQEKPYKNASQAYNAALNLMKDDQLDNARQAFEIFLQEHSTSTLAPLATYWWGVSLLLQYFPERALVVFETFQRNWPHHEKIPSVTLKVAFCHQALGFFGKAESVLRAFLKKLPSSTQKMSASQLQLKEQAENLLETLLCPKKPL